MHRLLIDVRHHDRDTVLAEFRAQIGQVAKRGRVHRGHIAHADDDDLVLLPERELREFVGHGEEHRAVDLIDTDAVRHGLETVKFIDRLLVLRDVRPGANFRHVRHSLEEQERRKHHADLDRDNKVKSNRKGKRSKQNKNIALRSRLADVAEMTPLAHVVRHHEQD